MNHLSDIAFTFTPDEQRRFSELYDDQDNLVKKIYYNGNYEVIETNGTTYEVNYLFAPEGLFGIAVKENNNPVQVYYTETDHLGSILGLYNEAGQPFYTQSFDAWGRERNPETWDYTTNTGTKPEWLIRGYTGHEHLAEQLSPFGGAGGGLINMNGRMYDPVLGRMLSPDNFVQDPSSTQSFNRYSYCWNNPLKYTDPSGEVVGMLFFALGFVADLSSNLINGVSNPIGTAYNNVTRVSSGMSNCLQFSIYQNDNTNFTAGLDPFALGISANYSRVDGNFSTRVGAGIGLVSGGFANVGFNYTSGDISIGVGAGLGENHYSYGGSFTYKGYGGGYYKTHYGNATGPDGLPNKQIVGGVNVYARDFSIRVENDFLAGDGDRWRSNAIEIGYKNLYVGTRLYNNDPEGEGQKFDIHGRSRSGKLNKHGNGAWEKGMVYNSPLWVGYRNGNNIERIGFQHPMMQDKTQNWVHRNGCFHLPFGRTHYFNNYDQFQYGIFMYTGYYNPYSLWGK